MINISSSSCIAIRYDEGDDNMKKVIGEAMLKSQTERMNK